MDDELHPFIKPIGELIVAVILLAGGLISATMATQTISLYLGSYSWVPAQQTVIDSRGEIFNCGDDHTCTRPVISVEYNVNDHRYHAAGYSFNFPAGNTFIDYSPADVEQIVRQYPIGSKVNIFYDPANPQQMIVERRLNWLSWLICVLSGLILLSYGVLGIVLFTFDFAMQTRIGRTVYTHFVVKS